jgi:ABC-type branched-subunit amino acid transport system ATPase component
MKEGHFNRTIDTKQAIGERAINEKRLTVIGKQAAELNQAAEQLIKQMHAAKRAGKTTAALAQARARILEQAKALEKEKTEVQRSLYKMTQ